MITGLADDIAIAATTRHFDILRHSFGCCHTMHLFIYFNAWLQLPLARYFLPQAPYGVITVNNFGQGNGFAISRTSFYSHDIAVCASLPHTVNTIVGTMFLLAGWSLEVNAAGAYTMVPYRFHKAAREDAAAEIFTIFHYCYYG